MFGNSLQAIKHKAEYSANSRMQFVICTMTIMAYYMHLNCMHIVFEQCVGHYILQGLQIQDSSKMLAQYCLTHTPSQIC